MPVVDRTLFDRNDPAHKLGQYQAWMLGQTLDWPIDMIWTSIAPAVNQNAHRVLPHGEPSIAILRTRNTEGQITNPRLIICGPNTGAHWYRPDPLEELIAVRLRPEISACVFGVDPGELLSDDSGLRHAPKVVQHACDRVLSAAHHGDAHQVAILLAQSILKNFDAPVYANRPEIHGALLMRSTNGALNARDVAKRFDVSERHFRRRFRDHIGVSPKTYARQLRLTFAMLAAEQHANPNWAQLALSAGFHDQPHMINEFQSMIGVSPKLLHTERRNLSGFYNQ